MNKNSCLRWIIPAVFVFFASACCHVNHLKEQGPPKAVTVESSSSAVLELEFTRHRSKVRGSSLGNIEAARISAFDDLERWRDADPLAMVHFLNRAVAKSLKSRLGWKRAAGGDLLRIVLEDIRLVASDSRTPFVVQGSLRATLERDGEIVWRDCVDIEIPPAGHSIEGLSQGSPDLWRSFWKSVASRFAKGLTRRLQGDLKGPSGS